MTTLMVESYEQALKANPGNLIFLKLAKLLIDGGQNERAIEVCQQGLRFHPNSIIAHVLNAKAHLALKNFAAALLLLQHTAEIAPNDPQAFNLSGAILQQAQLHREALFFLERAVELQPADMAALRRLELSRSAVVQALDKTDIETLPGSAQASPKPFLETQPVHEGAASFGARPASEIDPFAPLASTDTDLGEPELPTMVEMDAYVPAVPSFVDEAGEPTSLNTSVEPQPSFSPFDQMADDAKFDDTDIPTMVDVTAYPTPPEKSEETSDELLDENGSFAPIDPLPEANASPSHDLHVPFDEDQRELSAIFRSLDADDSNDALAAAPSQVPWEPSQEAMGEGGVPTQRLLSSLLGSPSGMRRTSSEAINASKGWFAPENILEEPAERMSMPSLKPERSPHVSLDPKDGTEIEEFSIEARSEDNLTEEEASPETEAELESPQAPARVTHTPPPLPPSAALAKPEKRPGLLDELPEEAIFSTPPRPAQMPSVVVASQTAEEIAREYERELRAKLLTQPPPSFLRQHWIKLTAVAVLVLLGLAGSFIYQNISKETQGERVGEWRSQAMRALSLATPQAYRDAIELADRLLKENPGDAEAQVIRAFASASLFRRFGQFDGDRVAAEKITDAARARAPGLVLIIDHLLDAEQKTSKSKALAELAKLDLEKLNPGFERAEVHLLLAERFIAQKKLEDASRHLTQSIAEDPSHVETLLASGNNFLNPTLPGQRSSPDQAYVMFDRAQQISPKHVGAIVGLLQSALARSDQLPEDDRRHLELLQKARELYETSAKSNAPWPALMLSQLDLAEGQLRSRLDEPKAAADILTQGASRHPELVTEFQNALGQAHMRAGDYDLAAEVFSRLSKKSPKDAQSRIFLARALLALGEPQEALKVTEALKGNRDLTILKGIALYEMGRSEKAREVLQSTAPDGQNMPSQAAIYLALIDAEMNPEENLERSLNVLSQNIGPRNRWWPLAQSVRGRLLLKKGHVIDGRDALTTAATKDPLDFESHCILGRFEATSGQPELARTQLERSLERNRFHLEARLALSRILLMLGDLPALEKILDPALEGKAALEAQHLQVHLELVKGNLAVARTALTKMRKTFPKNPETLLTTVQFFALSGEEDQMQADLKRLRASPPKVRAALADRLRRQGDLKEASTIYESLVKLDAGDPWARIGRIEIAIESNDKKGRNAALKDLDALIESIGKKSSVPSSIRARILAARAQVLVKDKKKGPAQRQLAEALATSSFTPEVHLVQARAAKLWGEPSEVVSSLERALRLDPALAQAHLELGLFLVQAKSDLPRARQSLETALRLFRDGPQALQARQTLAQLAQVSQDAETRNAPPSAPEYAKGKASSSGKAKDVTPAVSKQSKPSKPAKTSPKGSK